MGNTPSTKEKSVEALKISRSKECLQKALLELRKKQTKDKCVLMIDRENALFPSAVSYLKAPNSELSPLEIQFTVDGCTENVVNLGGPNKEFFALVFQSCLKKELDMFERSGAYIIPVGNRGTIQGEMFSLLGKTIVVSLCCGGPAFSSLAPYVVSYIRGREYEHQLEVSLIANDYLRTYIHKISRAETQMEIDKAVGEDDEKFLDHCGWPRPEMVTLAKKDQYIQVLLHWELIGKRKEALDQMREGLNCLGFLEKVKDLDELETLLSADNSRETTACYVRETIVAAVRKLECKGFDEEKAQTFTIMCMEDFTDDECCGLYQFITGLDYISHVDFPIDVEFNRSDRSAMLPEASTCIHKFLIPLGNYSKVEFYSSFNAALKHGRVGFSEKEN